MPKKLVIFDTVGYHGQPMFSYNSLSFIVEAKKLCESCRVIFMSKKSNLNRGMHNFNGTNFQNHALDNATVIPILPQNFTHAPFWHYLQWHDLPTKFN